jgi:PAS domain S-box-containing protein
MSENLVDGRYRFEDLVDIERLRNIFEKFSAVTGYTTGLVSYPDQELLIGTGWRDVCTKFHREYDSSNIHCKTSNIELTSHLKTKKEMYICKCQSGLIDGATPIIVDGVHIANLATGQALFEPPDMEMFRRQGEEYGYDVESYLKAVQETPVVSEDQFKKVLEFLSGIAVILAEQALMKLRNQQTNIKLKKQEEYSKTLFENSRIPLVIIHAETFEILDCNKAAVSIYGFQSKSEIMGKNPSIVSAPVQDDGSDNEIKGKIYIEEALKTGHVVFNWKHQRPSGEFWDAEVQLTAINIDGSQRLLFTLQDISERLRIENERNILEKQLMQSQKMDAIGQLAGGIAHDFNNMLGGIMGAAQLLRSPKRQLDAKGLELVNTIMNASERAAELVSKLLIFGRIENNDRQTINVHDALDSTLSILSQTINKNISLKCIKNATRADTNGSDSELQNVFINLGINAAHAMPDGGQLTFTTNNVHITGKECEHSQFDIDPGEFIRITVKDSGCGISKEAIAQIFDPFFTTKKEGQGTGLGLSTVYGTIKSCKGAISVSSEPGHGTIFHILLPIAENSTTAERDTQKPVLRGSGKLLLVDDEEIIRQTTATMLRDAGYEVITASDGVEAIELYEQDNCIDLVIIDMVMPNLNGTDTFYKLRELNENCQVILTSGFPKGEDIQSLQAAGLQAFIKKPFQNEELLKILSEVLNRNV